MDFYALAYQFCNFLLTFFSVVNDKKENFVPEPRTLPSEDFNAAIEKAISPFITRLENCEAQILELKNKAVTERVDALETKMNSSEDQILELKNKERVPVVFSAAVGLGNYHFPKTPYNTDKPLIFKRVITNIGNGYKNDTGHFDAPFAGIYYFVFFHHAGGSSGTNLYLYKGEERIVQAQNHKLSVEKAFNGGNAAFLQLKKDDRVSVRMEKDSHVWASDTHTTFSGFLVEKTEDKKADNPP